MADIIVDTDTDLSDLSPTLEDRIVVKDDATLTVDTQGRMNILQIGDSTTEGHIVFDGYDATLENPTLIFKRDRGMGSGIRIFRGSISVVSPFEGRIILISSGMSIGSRDWCITADSSSDISRDLELVDTDSIEMYGVAFSLIYRDPAEAVNLILPTNPNPSRSLKIDVQNRNTERSSPWQEYKWTDGEELDFRVRLRREDIDRYERQRLNYYTRYYQDGKNSLLVSESKFGFGKIYDLRFNSTSPLTYDFNFRFVEERIR